jgi:glycosyltransferase involved in cell wall biosynthesis
MLIVDQLLPPQGLPFNFYRLTLLPTLSIIVPSFNQAAYLEETLQSIIGQQYPGLELMVIDGGSTDGSVAIIRKYEAHISYWVSEPDRGQSHAINKGFEKATGEWVAWMNSDDCYLEHSLVPFFEKLSHTSYDFLHGLVAFGETIEKAIVVPAYLNYRRSIFHLLLFFMANQYIIPSQSVFVRRSLLEKAGLLREDLHYVMDMEWYIRLYKASNRRYFYHFPISFFRLHTQSKTVNYARLMQQEVWKVADEYLPGLNSKQRWTLKKLIQHYDEFQIKYSEAKGPLSQISLAIMYPFHYWYKFNWDEKWYKLRHGAGNLPFKGGNTL